MKDKKTSLQAIDSILGEEENQQESNNIVVPAPTVASPKRGRGRPKDDDYEARTFRVRRDLAEKIRIISDVEGRKQKDIMEYALNLIITKYEDKHGKIDITKEYHKNSIENIF